MTWQTIDTAPTDGTEVIGIHYRDGGGIFKPTTYGPWTMVFEGGKWRPSWDGFDVIRSQHDFGTEYQDFDGDPTHWHPMPAFNPAQAQENSHG